MSATASNITLSVTIARGNHAGPYVVARDGRGRLRDNRRDLCVSEGIRNLYLPALEVDNAGHYCTRTG